MNGCQGGGSIAPRPATWRFMPLQASCLAACATTAAVDQIKYFSQAFGAVNAVGQALLDDLAMAERTQGQQIASRRAKGESQVGADDCPRDQISWQGAAGKPGIIRGFCLHDAAYFSDLDDPPATAQLRAALTIIERYADLLSALSNGHSSEAALGAVDALSHNVSGLLGKLQTAWKLTVAAANALPGKIPLTVLVQQSATLKADADAARRIFSILRSGAMATSAR
jgi:hypothetical protein